MSPKPPPRPESPGIPPDDATPPAPARDDHIALGRRGEDAALTYLLRNGYTLVARNYRFGRHGELDLVMTAPGGDLVFVEVKTRRQDAAGDPLAWITPLKQRKIQRIAQAFCLQHGIGDRPMRFDAVSVDARDGTRAPVVRHVPNAFLPDGAGYWR